MAVISIVDIIFAIPLFGFDAWYVIIAVTICTVSVIMIDAVCATLSRWIFPKKWFGIDKTIFSAGKKECRFYEKIGRFPAIEEDEAPYRLLCNEYPVAE